MKDYKRRILVQRIVSDVFSTIVAWFLAFYLRFYVLPGRSDDNPISLFTTLSLFACAFTLFFCSRQGLYDGDILNTFAKEAGKIFRVSVYVFLSFVCVYYYLFPAKISRIALLLFFLFHFIFMLVGRRTINTSFETKFRKVNNGGLKAEKVLLVGSGSSIEEFYKATIADNALGKIVVGQYCSQGNGINNVNQIFSSTLEVAILQTKADTIVISTTQMTPLEEKRILEESMEILEQNVILIPSVPKSYVGTELSLYHSIPIININTCKMSALGRISKRLFDIVSCSLGVLLLSPLFIIISILVKCTSKGPIFFKQNRVTKDGKVFKMLKFRSMRIDMPEGDPHLTEENDPRVTKIGKILRKTSLDEIPQFFNVIAGSMSLIGPRPERPELEAQFMKTIPGYNMRHKMKAGISGWAQVNGLRGNTSIEERIDYDLYYIRNWSFSFDMKIVIFTFFKGFINKNAY